MCKEVAAAIYIGEYSTSLSACFSVPLILTIILPHRWVRHGVSYMPTFSLFWESHGLYSPTS